MEIVDIRLAMLLSGKIHVKKKTITSDKEGIS